MIESWWRSLEHGWLCLHHWDNVATLRNLSEFYVVENNTVMPHSALNCQTPDEMCFGRGEAVPKALALKRREAQRKRIDQIRKVACSDCREGSN